MLTIPSKSTISSARRRLMELMQSLQFGRIEHLAIRAGEPVLDSTTIIIREIKFGSESAPRQDLAKRDFQLKAQVVDLFASFERLGEGIVMTLEVKHGLPFRMLIAESFA